MNSARTHRATDEPLRHAAFVRRAVVSRPESHDAVQSALATLRARVSPDRVDAFDASRLRYRRDAPLALGVVAVATFTLGLLGHATVARAAHARFAAIALAILLDACALVCVVSFLRALQWRYELDVVANAIRAQSRGVRGWRVRATAQADDVIAVLIVGAPGARRVVMVGARNSELLEVHRERWLDPPGLSDWMCDAAALIASAALLDRDPGARTDLP